MVKNWNTIPMYERLLLLHDDVFFLRKDRNHFHNTGVNKILQYLSSTIALHSLSNPRSNNASVHISSRNSQSSFELFRHHTNLFVKSSSPHIKPHENGIGKQESLCFRCFQEVFPSSERHSERFCRSACYISKDRRSSFKSG